MIDPPVLAAAGTALNEVAKSFHVGWMLCRDWMIKGHKNKIVGEYMAQIEAAEEIKLFLEQKNLHHRAIQNLPPHSTPEQDLPIAELQTRAIENFCYDQSWQQNNRDAIAVLAHEALTQSGFMDTDEANNPDAPPRLDEDFMARFYRYAGDISKEEAQQLWAKLLADEIQKPGSFSVYALEVLRSMTKQDLEYMNLLSGFMFGNKLLVPAEPVNHESNSANLLKATRQFDVFSFSPSRAPDAGQGMYRPAFERLKQLGLCSGLADSALTMVFLTDCNQIMLRNGTLNLHSSPCLSDVSARAIFVDTIEAHNAFFELAALLEPEPFPAAGIIPLCMALEVHNLSYSFAFPEDYCIEPTVLLPAVLNPIRLRIINTYGTQEGLYSPPAGSLATFLLSGIGANIFFSGTAVEALFPGTVTQDTPENTPHAVTLAQLAEDLNNCETISEIIETIQAVFREDRGEEEEK